MSQSNVSERLERIAQRRAERRSTPSAARELTNYLSGRLRTLAQGRAAARAKHKPLRFPLMGRRPVKSK